MPRCGVCRKPISSYGYLKLHIEGSKKCRRTLRRRQARSGHLDDTGENALPHLNREPNASSGQDSDVEFDYGIPVDDAVLFEAQNSTAGSPDPNGPLPPSSQSPLESGDTFIEEYPAISRAGHPISHHPSIYEQHASRLKSENQSIWGTFRNEEEWDLAKWLVNCGVSQNKLKSFFKLPIVSGPGYRITQTNLISGSRPRFIFHFAEQAPQKCRCPS